MAKKKRSGPNKSEAIREVLRKDSTATAKAIIPELAEKGIKVTQDLVNNVRSIYLRSEGIDGKKKPAGAKRKPSSVRPSKGALSYDDLLKVKQVAESLGGIEETKKALAALEELR
ncbi:MAG: hypothetical protein NXI22_22765 [bacterium]|nr:hypothetical protein [bacterium]